jgi:lipopolysaccharide export system permease protein
MRILTRYVLFDLLKVFFITLTGLTMLIFVVLIGKEAVDKGISLGPLIRMAPYLLPQAMQFAVPGTMLMAATYVYGRMSSYNEIVAIKSLGISPMCVIWPTFMLATLVSFGAVLLNDIAVSWGRLGVQRVFLASIEEVTYGQLRTKHTYNRPRRRRPPPHLADAHHSILWRSARAHRVRRRSRAPSAARRRQNHLAARRLRNRWSVDLGRS